MKITLFSAMRDKFLSVFYIAWCISAVIQPVNAQVVYAEDVLEQMNAPVKDPCPAWQATQAPLTREDARLLACNLVKEVELAPEFPEHVTRARNDVIIAWLLEKGVPFASVRRVYLFNRNGQDFLFDNKRFQGRFSRDWQVVFGSRPRKMELVDYERRFALNLTGKNSLKSPYEAVALQTGDGLQVVDAAFLPALLSPEEWKAQLGGKEAIAAVSGLDSVPEIMVALLPDEPKERLRRTLAIEKFLPWDAEQVQQQVHEMPESMRLQVYADMLQFWEANPLYPLRWQKDSLGWDEVLPWRDGANNDRLDRAFAEMMPLLSFRKFWKGQKNDEAALEAVKAQMERGSKRKDRIEFDLRVAVE